MLNPLFTQLFGREVVDRLDRAGFESNADIADQLFISTNTVARQISGNYSKTESENRVQDANYSREHRLLD